MNDGLTRGAARLWILAACVVGGALRLGGLASDFWLDEVWSWGWATRLDAASTIFTGIHHSNNHHLSSLWMWALGADAPVWAYRLPSTVAGLATVPLAAALAWPRGRLEAVVAAWAVALCFVLVHFPSEARGYAPAIALALGAQLLLRRALTTDDWRPVAGFGTCVALGLLSHLGFAFYWAGAMAESVWRGRGAPPRETLRRLVRLHALPAGVLLLLYAVDLQYLKVGGGNPTDLQALSARTFGFALGLPTGASLGVPYAIVGGLALLGAWGFRIRRGGGDAIGDAVTIVLAPLVVFLWTRPEVIAVRYFAIGIAFALVLIAEPLAAGLRRGGATRSATIVVLVVLGLGSLAHDAAFLWHGRGGFRETLQTLSRHSGKELRVASDHDFRNATVLRFYARELPPGQRLVYQPGGGRDGAADWFLAHRPQRPARVAPVVRDLGGHEYAFFAEFDHAAISGFYWALYRASDATRSSTSVPKAGPAKGSAPKR